MKNRVIIAALSCVLLMPVCSEYCCVAVEAETEVEAADNGLWTETDIPVSVR